MKAPRKRVVGAVLIESILVLVPYLAIMVGGMEYLWFLHIKQSFTKAADAAVRIVAINHYELVDDVSGVSSQSLDPYRADATAAAQNVLLNIGFSSSFVSQAVVTVDYLNNLATKDSRLSMGGFPQNDHMRLVGVRITVPWDKAMIFGNFASTVLNLTFNFPSEFNVTVFRWKKWKIL